MFSVYDSISDDVLVKSHKMTNLFVCEYKRYFSKRPSKLAVILWGSEYKRTHGANFWQLCELLGVNTQRTAINDVNIVADKMTDVTVVMSGSLRDEHPQLPAKIAHSIRWCCQAEKRHNSVLGHTAAYRSVLEDEGFDAHSAQEVAYARCFAAAPDQFGTGILPLIFNAPAPTRQMIAERFIESVSTVYGLHHGVVTMPHLLNEALSGCEAIMMSRSSLRWGPLSLDHILEFIGGLSATLSVLNNVEPPVWFCDYRTDTLSVQSFADALREEILHTIASAHFHARVMVGEAAAQKTILKQLKHVYGFLLCAPFLIPDDVRLCIRDCLVEDSFFTGMSAYLKRTEPDLFNKISEVLG